MKPYVFDRRLSINVVLGGLSLFLPMVSQVSVAANESSKCKELRASFFSDKSNRYVLDQSLERGAKEGEDQYFNLDLDGDDISDVVSRSCPGSIQMQADPCVLSVELSSGRKFDFEGEYRFQLMRYSGKVYLVSSENIYSVSGAGVNPVCPKN
jgi:hypothetical protein